MTSQSGIGQARITLQFDLNRDIDGAARDVQAAINAARADLPTNLPSNPTYRKVNPADAPILILALTSKTLTRGQMYDAASNVLAQRLSQLERHRQGHHRRLERCPRCASSSTRRRSTNMASGSRTCAPRSPRPTPTARKAPSTTATARYQIYTNDQANVAADYTPLVIAYRNGAGGAALRRRRRSRTRSRTCATSACPTASRRCWSFCSASRAPTSSRPSTP